MNSPVVIKQANEKPLELDFNFYSSAKSVELSQGDQNIFIEESSIAKLIEALKQFEK